MRSSTFASSSCQISPILCRPPSHTNRATHFPVAGFRSCRRPKQKSVPAGGLGRDALDGGRGECRGDGSALAGRDLRRVAAGRVKGGGDDAAVRAGGAFEGVAAIGGDRMVTRWAANCPKCRRPCSCATSLPVTAQHLGAQAETAARPIRRRRGRARRPAAEGQASKPGGGQHKSCHCFLHLLFMYLTV